MTGEEEDTDVGFAGPAHFIAEREWPMRIAMGALAFMALVAGALQIPGVDDFVGKFLDPTFADSKYAHVAPSLTSDWVGLALGAVTAVLGISIAWMIWVARRGTAARLRERFATVYGFLAHKWYFDELIDYTIVRPAQWFGGWGQAVIERIVIGGGVTDGTLGVVRAGSAVVRRGQTGFVRYYAALMVVCIFGVALYFLVAS